MGCYDGNGNFLFHIIDVTIYAISISVVVRYPCTIKGWKLKLKYLQYVCLFLNTLYRGISLQKYGYSPLVQYVLIFYF
jgi:hypothetical protein